jgi:hypothetical protein
LRARVRVSGYASGSGTATLIATEAPGVPGGATVTVSGTVATDPTDEDARVLGRVKVHDGTDTAQVSAGGALLTDGSATTQPISAASLPLPTGAATSALQDGIVRDGAGDTTQANVSGGRLHVDGSGVTQPVSAASLPLPAGAATAANQLPDGHNVTVDNASGAAAVNVQDGGNSLTVDGTVTANAGTNLNTSALALESGGNLATVAGAVDATGTTVPASAAFVAGSDGTNTRALKTDAGGELQVDVLSSALPTGASTSAEQTTQTASLSVLDDWDETDRAKVNLIPGQAGVAANAGDASASTVRVAEAGATGIAYAQVSCTTSATQIAAARAGRRAINVTLLASGTDVYFGDASVTTAAGDKLLGIDGASRSYPTSAALYCRVGAGSVTVSYLEVY